MTLSAILATHAENLSQLPVRSVTRCDARSVGAPSVTPVTPVTPGKQGPKVETQNAPDSLQFGLAVERQQLTDHKADIMALHAIRARLHGIAKRLGIPRTVVDNLPAEDLAATAEQAQWCEGHTDRNGNPMAQSLLVAYVKLLADMCEQLAGVSNEDQ